MKAAYDLFIERQVFDDEVMVSANEVKKYLVQEYMNMTVKKIKQE